MKAVIQRVSGASIAINGGQPLPTGRGLVVLLGVARGDRPEDATWLAGKIAAMRIFADNEGKMNLSINDIAGDMLIVSQFTLTADTRKGNRPSFNAAAPPEEAVPLYEGFVSRMRQLISGTLQTGEFGANMQISLTNDGPVTIILDSRARS